MYEYKAILTRVYDGDTIWCNVDLGFKYWAHDQSFRLIGIQAPEMGTAEGRRSKLFLANTLPVGAEVTITTVKDKREKYGRMLADVFYNNVHINKLMVDKGMAVEWDGKGPRPLGWLDLSA